MRSSRRNFGAIGVVALEEEERRIEAEQQAEAVAEEPVEDNANSLETDLIEVADQEGEATDISDTIEEGADTVEALEGLREAVRVAGRNGGLDRNGATVARVALGAFYKRAGFPSQVVKNPTPALEMFGGTSDRVRSTMALEAEIGQKITKIWESIKVIVMKAIAFAVEWFNKIFDGATKLGERASKLVAQLGELDGAPNTKEIENERLAESLFIGNGVPVDGNGAKVVVEVLKTTYADYPAFLDQLSKVAEAAGEGKADGIQALLSEGSAMKLGLDDVANPASAGIQVAEGAKVSRSKEMPGGKALVVTIVPGDADKSGAAIMAFDTKAAAPAGGKVGVLEKGAAETQAKAVGEIADLVKTGKANLGKMSDTKKKLVSFLDRAAKGAEGEDDKKDMQKSAQAFRGVLKLIDAPFIQLNGYALNAGKALLDQVEQSIKAHGKKEAAPAAAAAA